MMLWAYPVMDAACGWSRLTVATGSTEWIVFASEFHFIPLFTTSLTSPLNRSMCWSSTFSDILLSTVSGIVVLDIGEEADEIKLISKRCRIGRGHDEVTTGRSLFKCFRRFDGLFFENKQSQLQCTVRALGLKLSSSALWLKEISQNNGSHFTKLQPWNILK